MQIKYVGRGYHVTTEGDYFIPISKHDGLILPEAKWAELLKAYTGYDGNPAKIAPLAKQHGLPSAQLKKVFAVMGVTHDSDPIPLEQIKSMTTEEMADELVRFKMFAAMTMADNKINAQLEADAEKYRNLERLAEVLEGRIKAMPTAAATVPKASATEENYDLVLGISDWHHGGYSSAAGKEWNRKISRNAFRRSWQRMIEDATSSWGGIRRIVIPVGGDAFHVDNFEHATTRGTAQDVDGIYYEIVSEYFEMMTELTDYARHRCVEVSLVFNPGNHDRHTTFMLAMYLQGYYREADDVQLIGFEPSSLYGRAYLMAHGNLLQFTHGDIGNPKDWPMMAETEVPKMYRKCKGVFSICGHHHIAENWPTFSKSIFIRMPTVVPSDQYHRGKGYPNMRVLESYKFDKFGWSGTLRLNWSQVKRLIR